MSFCHDVICTLREDQETLLQSSEADEIDGDPQEATNSQANPAYFGLEKSVA